MKWKRVAPWLLRRECGRYTIDHFPIPGSVTGERWTAWRKDEGMSAVHLGCYDSQREAMSAVAADLRARAPR